MIVTPTRLPEVLLLQPKVFGDARGFFMESWNAKTFAEVTGVQAHFVQDNHSRSARHVLRGIHYQLPKPQGKLVRVTQGRVWDVAVDLRRASPRFGQWVGVELNAEQHQQLWVPPGFGHGFMVLSESADFLYKTTEYWHAEHERSLAWNDPQLAITWPLVSEEGGAQKMSAPLLAAKDAQAPHLKDALVYEGRFNDSALDDRSLFNPSLFNASEPT
jgi:dTDP-4-dehydrorhamnose 3,5-epimerase